MKVTEIKQQFAYVNKGTTSNEKVSNKDWVIRN